MSAWVHETYKCVHAARASTHTETHTHKCLTVALPPQPAPFLSVAARSMRGSPGGACAGTRTAAKPTADQIRVLGILKQLAEADTNTNTNTNTNNNNNLHPTGTQVKIAMGIWCVVSEAMNARCPKDTVGAPEANLS